MNNKDSKYLEYRMKRLESTIEFVGGFSQLFKNEQEEYRRLRAYFLSIKRRINHD